MKEKTVEELWQNFQSSGKSDDRDKLIVNYLSLVKLAVGRVAAGLPSHIKMDDLYSSGVTGLIRAVEKYDPSKGGKFEGYASLLIKGSIIDELRELDWIPRSVHQKANMITAAQDALQQKLGRDPSDAELASHLGLSVSELNELCARVRPAILIPLNAELTNEDDESTSISEKIPDDSVETGYEAAERREFNALVEKAIDGLPEKERRVLVLYYFEELMLKEIGKILGVSESRVSQIHTKALLKLRGRLRHLIAENAQN